MVGDMRRRAMRVGVIGAGAAGLCVARHAAADPAVSLLRVFEGAAGVGGTWTYSEATASPDGRPLHSSMYANMRTNLPKEVMAFPDFPFPPSEASFLRHSEVQAYLEAYAEHFRLHRFIRFRCPVEGVERAAAGGWLFRLGDGQTEAFDAVFVCNGHYAQPHSPALPGQDGFTGRLLHSHSYRRPETLKDQRVVVLGSGPSGTDIAIDLSPQAAHVFLCHNHEPLRSFLPGNVEQRAGILPFEGPRGVRLTDGSLLEEVDAVVLCTGYEYSFPFLDGESLGLRVEGGRGVSPLYQHLVAIPQPSLLFVGLTKTVCPFPQFDAQALFGLWLLGHPGAVTREAMEESLREDEAFRAEFLPYQKVRHFMGPLQWDYNRKLAAISGLPDRIPKAVEKLYDEIHRYRVKNLCTYKDERFELVDEDTFRHIDQL